MILLMKKNLDQHHKPSKEHKPKNGRESDDEFELDIEWTAGQSGLLLGGPLQLRDRSGKNIKLVYGFPMVIFCEDGPVVVEKTSRRTVIRDAQTGEVIYEGDDTYDGPDDSSSDASSSDSGSSSSSEEQGSPHDSEYDSNSSSSSDSGPDQPPVPQVLPPHLVPARIRTSSDRPRHLPTTPKSGRTANQFDKRNILAATRPSSKTLAKSIGYPIPSRTRFVMPGLLITPFPTPDGRPIEHISKQGLTPTKTSSAFANAVKTGRFLFTSPQSTKSASRSIKKPLSSETISDDCSSPPTVTHSVPQVQGFSSVSPSSARANLTNAGAPWTTVPEIVIDLLTKSGSYSSPQLAHPSRKNIFGNPGTFLNQNSVSRPGLGNSIWTRKNQGKELSSKTVTSNLRPKQWQNPM